MTRYVSTPLSHIRLARLARLAWRESRSARRRLLLYMSSIAIGVAALVSIDSFAANVTRSVREQSRTLLGGDIQLTSRRAFPAAADSLLDSLRRRGIETAQSTTFPSMALVPRTGGSRLVQIRGVGPQYPLYGRITTRPADQYERLQSGPYALVDPTFLIAANGRIGDTLTLGKRPFIIIGTLDQVPGTSEITTALGPRVYVAEQQLRNTDLIGFGSIAERSVLLKLPPNVDAKQFAKPLQQRLMPLQMRVRTVTDTQQAAASATETLSAFIGIIGLVALLLGGLGVASGVRAFVASKIDTVAVLRCLGATSGEILAMYVAQAALMGLIGAVGGAVLGLVVQWGLPRVIAPLLPVDVSVSLEPQAIVAGILVGGWVALIFSLRPLLALRHISPLQTLRRDADADALKSRSRRSQIPRIAIDLVLVTSVVVVALLRARTVKEGLWISVATGLVMLVLMASAALLGWIARRTVRDRWPYVVRQGIANVYRPANQTRAVILSLGFGAFLITTIALVQTNLLSMLHVNASASGANLLFFDVQDAQGAPLDSLVRARGFRVVQRTPMVPMRIAQINGVSTVALTADTTNRRARWALRREYRSTYRDSLYGGERLVAGHWFKATSSNAPADTSEVSLDQGLAKELRVRVGDILTWDVQGVLIPTRVTSLRKVTWTRFEPNFFAVFPSQTLRSAPKQFILLAEVRGARNIALLQRDVVARYPNVSVLDLSVISTTIGRIVDRVTTAIRFLALFVALMGIPVIISAAAATQRDRMHEMALLRTLGATRRQILHILTTEYVSLGVLSAATGLLLATGANWLLLHCVFDH